jgi:hypothetical protein
MLRCWKVFGSGANVGPGTSSCGAGEHDHDECAKPSLAVALSHEAIFCCATCVLEIFAFVLRLPRACVPCHAAGPWKVFSGADDWRRPFRQERQRLHPQQRLLDLRRCRSQRRPPRQRFVSGLLESGFAQRIVDVLFFESLIPQA